MKNLGPEREGTFRAPLGSASRGRLVLVGGASHLIVESDPAMNGLYRARFQEPVPDVRVEGSTVIVCYPRLRPIDSACLEYLDEVVLGVRVPWQVEFGGGVSRLTADLSGLELGSFQVEGGAGRVELRLPNPSGSVPVRFHGGASNVAVRRPKGVAARLRVSGGVTNLSFDGRHSGVVGDEVDLRTPDYDDACRRYDIAITGGANNLTVDGVRADLSAPAGTDPPATPREKGVNNVSEIEVENLRKRCRGPRGEDAPFTVEESENFGMVDPNNTGETTTVEGVNDPRPNAGSLCSEVRT